MAKKNILYILPKSTIHIFIAAIIITMFVPNVYNRLPEAHTRAS